MKSREKRTFVLTYFYYQARKWQVVQLLNSRLAHYLASGVGARVDCHILTFTDV